MIFPPDSSDDRMGVADAALSHRQHYMRLRAGWGNGWMQRRLDSLGGGGGGRPRNSAHSRQAVIGPCVVRQKHPERVDAEQGAERGVDERQDAKRDAGDAGPALVLLQAPAHAYSSGGNQE